MGSFLALVHMRSTWCVVAFVHRVHLCISVRARGRGCFELPRPHRRRNKVRRCMRDASVRLVYSHRACQPCLRVIVCVCVDVDGMVSRGEEAGRGRGQRGPLRLNQFSQPLGTGVEDRLTHILSLTGRCLTRRARRTGQRQRAARTHNPLPHPSQLAPSLLHHGSLLDRPRPR